MVGEILDGKYRYDNKNKVGGEKFGIGYPQQYKVRWWDKPKNFSRDLLPKDVSKKLASVGTIKIFKYNISKLKNKLKQIAEETQTYHNIHEIRNEDDVKEYVEKFTGEIEPGLKIVEKEFIISETIGAVDFLAKDSKNRYVLIECKFLAKDSAIGQLLGYMNKYKEDKKIKNIRGIIIAKNIDNRCKIAVKNLNIDLYEVKIKPYFIKIYSQT